MTCPPPDDLGRFADDHLSPEERLAVEAHLDECDDCRSTVAMLARAATAERRSSGDIPTDAGDPSSEALAATELAPTSGTIEDDAKHTLESGSRLGRYVIAETLGMGGMGVVYAARDPDLDRDIAIKVLRPEFVRVHP